MLLDMGYRVLVPVCLRVAESSISLFLLMALRWIMTYLYGGLVVSRFRIAATELVTTTRFVEGLIGVY